MNKHEQLKGMEGANDFNYLLKVNHWNDNGNVLVGSGEEFSSVKEEEREASAENLKVTMEVMKKKVGRFINSINTEPSLLGDAMKSRQSLAPISGSGFKISFTVEGNTDVTQKMSYAGALNGRTHKGKLEVKFMPSSNGNEEGHVILLIDNLKKASIPFMNTLCGYMLDKKVAFPTLSAEVRKMWSNVGLEDIFMNIKGFIFFKFSSKHGSRQILDYNPWLIFNTYLIFLQR